MNKKRRNEERGRSEGDAEAAKKLKEKEAHECIKPYIYLYTHTYIYGSKRSYKKLYKIVRA